jgi:uncharacterized damage-inducible protein DinB
MSQTLARAAREHREALAATLDTFSQLDDDAWRTAWAPGKWTAAEIAEHLALSYEAALRDMRAEGHMVARAGPAWQRVLRVFLLPHILFHRRFPRARSPRETRPSGTGIPRESAIHRLQELGETVEDEAETAHAAGRSVFHPYFGALDTIRLLRLLAVHLEHHRAQAAACLAAADLHARQPV